METVETMKTLSETDLQGLRHHIAAINQIIAGAGLPAIAPAPEGAKYQRNHKRAKIQAHDYCRANAARYLGPNILSYID